MGNSNNFSSMDVYSPIGIYISSIVTSVILASLWFITGNLVVLIAAGFITPFLMLKLVHRDVTKGGKILAAILLILLFAICSLFFRAKVNDKIEEDVENPGIVIEDDVTPTDDTANQENTDNDSGADDESIKKQKVTKGTSKNKKGNVTPKPNEVIKPTYSGVGGDPSGTNVNTGTASSTNGDSNNIICEENTSKDYEEQIKNDVNNGKDVTNLDKGITATTDNKPKEEPKKDESTRVDVTDKNNNIEVIPSGNEPASNDVPKPLPDDEQLKEDVKVPTKNELDEMNNATVPEEVKKDDKVPTENKPTVPTKPTDTQDIKQDENIKNDSDSKLDNKVEGETTQTTNTPVTISCLSGSNAMAGDSVQFKVTGDVKSIEGLDGLNCSSLTNGYITVYTTPGVATVITPVVIGADGTSTATTSVTISVLN